jgi:hypothetical protein
LHLSIFILGLFLFFSGHDYLLLWSKFGLSPETQLSSRLGFRKYTSEFIGRMVWPEYFLNVVNS